MLTASNIKKSYGDLEVLRGVDIQVNKAEVISIVGASGAGKSTFLQILGTLDKADSGSLRIADTSPDTLNDKALSAFRNRHIGFIFQFHHLLPEFTALENVCMPGFIGKKASDQVKEKAHELLHLLKLDQRLHHKPGELSGGEQQRVAVARALVNAPSVVLADEPSGNLDSKNARELHELFFMLRKQLGQTFIIVTHNDQLADMADRKLTMKDGTILS